MVLVPGVPVNTSCEGRVTSGCSTVLSKAVVVQISGHSSGCDRLTNGCCLIRQSEVCYIEWSPDFQTNVLGRISDIPLVATGLGSDLTVNSVSGSDARSSILAVVGY